MSGFKKATRTAAKLRIGLSGPSGSGKTYTAIRLALLLGKRVAVIDTERGSASLYEGEKPDGVPFAYDVLELHSFEPVNYTQAIREAIDGGYDVLVIDSLSHAWNGVGGMLEQVDKTSGSSFNAWKNVTPQHNKLVDAILTAPLHVIFTLRSKTEYVQEKDPKTGKMVPRKIGMAPVFRDGIEYEATVFLDLDIDHTARVSKTRCAAIDGGAYHKPGPELARPLLDWLSGAPTPPPAPPADDEVMIPEETDDPTDYQRFVLGLRERGIDVRVVDAWRKSIDAAKPECHRLHAQHRKALFNALTTSEHKQCIEFRAWRSSRQPGEEG